MRNTKFKPILNKEKYVEALKEQVYPQLIDNIEGALESLFSKGILIDEKGKINKIGQDLLKYAIELNNGSDPIAMARKIKGNKNKGFTYDDLLDSVAIITTLAFFVKDGPEVFLEYLDYHNQEFEKEAIEKVERQKGLHKIYDAEIKVEQVKEEAFKKSK